MPITKGKNKYDMKTIKTVGSRASVYHGNAKHTAGGLRKSDLKKNKDGSIVSRKNSERARRKESPLLKLWRSAVSTVYKKPKYAGRFVPIKKGSVFYNEIKAEYRKKAEKAGICTKSGRRASKKRACKRGR